MDHSISLISTVAVGLAFAFIGGCIALRFRLPPLVGYLLAGIAVGPFTPGFVSDVKLAPQLAEIGVILLMFGVGMHFSVRDLMAVRGVAIPGAIAQIVLATAVGAAVGLYWGWSLAAGLVFGLALSVASTVVLLRALESNGKLNSEEGRIAVGWLIVEDLIMVLALVLLPALLRTPGTGGNADAASMPLWMIAGSILLKVGLFVALMLTVGARVLPWILKRVEATGSQELFTLAVVTLSLGIAFGSAELFGVSFALGAFFAGIVVHESDLNHKAESELRPLQNVFAALFFVSVGMLFDPEILITEPSRVLVVLAIVLIGKSLAALAVVLLLQRPLSTALTISAALAQIGEFSFILVGLGVTLGVLTTEVQSLVVAGALFSIILNPLVFYVSSRLVKPKVVDG